MNETATQTTLKSLAMSWAQGELSEENLSKGILEIEYPQRHVKPNGDVWYEGKLDNSVISVVDLALTGQLTDRQIGEFLTIIEDTMQSRLCKIQDRIG